MTRKIFYSFYIIASIVAAVSVSSQLIGISLSLINQSSTLAVILGVGILLVLLLLLMLYMYVSSIFIVKNILNQDIKQTKK